MSRFLHASRRAGAVIGGILVYVLIWLGFTLLIAGLGIRMFWGKISVGQMLLNLVSVQTDGGGGSIVWMGIIGIGVVPALLTFGVAIFRHFRARKRRRNGEDAPRRRPPWIRRSVSAVLVLALSIGGSSAFATTVNMADYLKSANSKYDMGDYYEEPQVTDDSKKNNIVTIYLESGEQTLADDQLFEKNAFAPLENSTQPSEGWQSVNDLKQYEGGGWTMAGLTSTQCGVPLKGPGLAQSSGSIGSSEGSGGSYLGGITCAGNVLANHGYKNVFLGGANGAFADKDKFLSSDGFSEEKDLSDWRAAGEPEENFRSDWGLSDGQLMAHAKDEIDQLHAESERTGQPFNLSMLTLDTHEPVHMFDYCQQNTDNEVTSVYECSMQQVAGYVDYMKEKGYLDDTSVVIMGDHLKHMSAGDAFHEQLDNNPNRSIFNRIWVPGENKNRQLRSSIDQLNMYPTILEAAGLDLKDHQAGLGVSAFTHEIPSDSAQAMNPDEYRDLLDSRSKDFYSKAWSG